MSAKIGNQYRKGLKPTNAFKKGHIPWNKGKQLSEKTKKKISEARNGKKHTEKMRKRLSEANKGERGSNWKGGINPINNTIRKGIECRLWREAVFAKDNWTCQKTGIKGCKLVAHHIKNFADYPELRFSINNGITLSEKAHREFHKKYGIKNNTEKQLKEFLRL